MMPQHTKFGRPNFYGTKFNSRTQIMQGLTIIGNKGQNDLTFEYNTPPQAHDATA